MFLHLANAQRIQNEKVYVQHNRIRWNENKADEFRQALKDNVLLGEINTAFG